jgi:hypothetical protein
MIGSDKRVGSIAAGVHAGIGSVAAGSTFAILMSAAMGRYGVPIVFSGVWAISTAVIGGIAAWKRLRGGGDGHGGRPLTECPDGDDGDGDGNNGDDDGVAIEKIGPSGGDGDSGGAAIVPRHKILLKPDRVLFHGARM